MERSNLGYWVSIWVPWLKVCGLSDLTIFVLFWQQGVFLISALQDALTDSDWFFLEQQLLGWTKRVEYLNLPQQKCELTSSPAVLKNKRIDRVICRSWAPKVDFYCKYNENQKNIVVW